MIANAPSISRCAVVGGFRDELNAMSARQHIAADGALAARVLRPGVFDYRDKDSTSVGRAKERTRFEMTFRQSGSARLNAHKRNDIGKRPALNMFGSEKLLEHCVGPNPTSPEACSARSPTVSAFTARISPAAFSSSVSGIRQGCRIRQILPDRLPCLLDVACPATAHRPRNEGEPGERRTAVLDVRNADEPCPGIARFGRPLLGMRLDKDRHQTLNGLRLVPRKRNLAH